MAIARRITRTMTHKPKTKIRYVTKCKNCGKLAKGK